MSVWLPAWPVDLLRRRERGSPDSDRRPLLLIARERQRQVVAACCERARAAGVRPGLPAAEARALFDAGDVRVEPHRPDRAAAALRSLAVWARRWSPIVAVDPPDGLLVDVTGCERVFRGEDRLLRLAREGLASLGLGARLAIAPTFGCAWAVARFGGETLAIIPAEGARAALAPLPIHGLRVEADLASQLREIGIERVGHLLNLPRSTLPPRFGDGLLLQLDRATGQAIETIEPVRPLPPPAVERVLDGPTDSTEAIELIVRTLLDELAQVLLAREAGAWSVRITLVRSDLAPERVSITLGAPCRDAKRLWSLARPKLERAHLGFGVEAVRVRAGSVGAIRHRQIERTEDPHALPAPEAERARSEMLDTLANRLGPDRVLRPIAAESHPPERAFVLRPALFGAPKHPAGVRPIDRPTVLLDRPAPARVIALTPDGPVHHVSWRGGDHAIVSCAGPERIAPEWWRSRGSTRDYFAAQTVEGRWLWVARSRETGRWHVHGVWA